MKRENISKIFQEEKKKIDLNVKTDIKIPVIKKEKNEYIKDEEKQKTKDETPYIDNIFHSIMKIETKKCEEEIGRQLTYSEIRELFG
jgi:hypothetical protein